MAREVPVYLFVGFLESGKSRFIQQTLEDERFNGGEKTLHVDASVREAEELFTGKVYPVENGCLVYSFAAPDTALFHLKK